MRPIAFGFVLLLAMLQASAQTPDWSSVQALPAGTQVRLETTSNSTRGTIQSVSNDSLILNLKNGQQTLARQDLWRVAVKKPSHRGRHTLYGLGIGAGAGLI